MSDFKVTPEVELNLTQMLERYHLQDESILHQWAQIHGINSSRGFFYPTEVDLLDHAHHHIRNLGMSLAEYRSLVERHRKPSETTIPQPTPTPNISVPIPNPTPVPTGNEATEIVELLTQQYGGAIDLIGEKIAEHLMDELDVSVMRHLMNKARERQQLTAQSPNRFMQMIKTAFQPSGSSLLMSKKQENSLELEQHHRLG